MSAQSPAAILDVHDLRRSYGRGANRFDALKGVSLRVDHGESLAIVGKSGSGKSTLMHLLALLDQPDDGALHVGGVDAATLTARQLSRLRNETFGFVPHALLLQARTDSPLQGPENAVRTASKLAPPPSDGHIEIVTVFGHVRAFV